jgi:hypothetical protein
MTSTSFSLPIVYSSLPRPIDTGGQRKGGRGGDWHLDTGGVRHMHTYTLPPELVLARRQDRIGKLHQIASGQLLFRLPDIPPTWLYFQPLNTRFQPSTNVTSAELTSSIRLLCLSSCSSAHRILRASAPVREFARPGNAQE